MNDQESKLSHPNRKISETFLDFASPFLPDPSMATQRRVEDALGLAHTVWNAVVLADVRGDQKYLDQIQTTTAGKPELVVIVEHLIKRKRDRFAADERLIGLWEVTKTKDGFNLHADARDPHASRGRSE